MRLLTRRNTVICGVLLSGVILAGLWVVGEGLEYRCDSFRVCEATGTFAWQTTRSFFGLRPGSPPYIEVSPLEKWMIEHGRPVARKWVLVGETGFNMFGRPMSFAYGTAPEIYTFPARLQAEYVKFVDDAEIESLVTVLATDDSAQKKTAIAAAFDRMKVGLTQHR